MPNSIDAIIPKYNDKTIWFTTEDEDKIVEKSYNISSSYKGILRLSPNAYGFLHTYNNTIDKNTVYRDSIDTYLSQPIPVSDSAGNILDLRLSTNGVESNNVYVIGAATANNLTISGKFIINDINYLPNTANEIISTRTEINDRYKHDYIPIDTTKPIVNEDGDSEVTDEYGDNDKSSILINKNINDRRFTYENTRNIIKELIVEALLDLQTIPTGSVHFIPITLDQYKELAHNKKFYHNRYAVPDRSAVVNPIVRDFLLCDGREYYCRDFPELAKIINGERIEYEYKEGEYQLIKEKYANKSITDSNDQLRTFRVPDLRHKFIKSSFLKDSAIGKPAGKTRNVQSRLYARIISQ